MGKSRKSNLIPGLLPHNVVPDPVTNFIFSIETTMYKSMIESAPLDFSPRIYFIVVAQALVASPFDHSTGFLTY